ncbi:hypothetical protein [Pelagerythrobacter aerophilus]|uniref:DUF4175 domain-containing protein n=1 Tax=Pelagerythrobacter aerophilus TaxID=2306995 RepID=A0A418NFJ6_9SPHN|nr:hypothetical protein [Pelagerythrobacter aerophilus]RIV76856.1 hypothetical protein D2V04_11985 [Pelagerythrobacter aerophilus]
MKPIAPSRRRTRQSLAHIFALPLALFAASFAGLVLGLTGEGAPDILAWALLSLPVLVVAVAWRRRGRPSPQRKI